MKYGFKRILSIFLAVLMLASMLPLSVYADEEECPHEYTAEVFEPTCTDRGYTRYTCALCGNSYDDDYTEASGHTPADAEEVPATCTESGRTAGTVCAVCGEALSGCEEIPASGHSYEAAVTEPTETEQGYTTYTCALCGDSYTDSYTGPNADGEELLNPEAEELSGLGLSLMASGSSEDILDSGTCGTSRTWTLDKNYLLTISGSGAMEDYYLSDTPWHSYMDLIKSVIIENGVTTIGSFAFTGCSNLTSITIPPSVLSIGDSAFRGCSSLASITIPYGVKRIGDSAFSNCTKLTSITIPASVETIGDSAFSSCTGLTSITILDSVKTIGSDAFAFCTKLTSITIPASVTSIGSHAFFSCSNLADVFYKGTSDEWNRITIGSNNDCLTKAEKHYSSTSGECGTSLTWKLDKNGLLTISGTGAMADYGSWATPWYSSSESIKSVIIENGVTSIGDYAFQDCTGLTNITIPASVTSIGEYAFYSCSKLADVFYKGTYDEWSSIIIRSNNDCLTKAHIHHSPTGGECGNNLSWVLYADGTLYIAGTGVMTGYGSPSDTPWYSFSESIKSVVIEHGVTSIGSNAFNGCSSLASITLPESLTSIGEYAFEGCGGLTSVFFNGTRVLEAALRFGTPRGNDALFSKTWIKSKGACGENISWVLDTNGVLTISGTGAMPDYVSAEAPWYKYCSLIKSAIIENGVTTIGSNAFWGCTELTSITILASVTSIGDYAFQYCTGLTSITIPASVTSIGEGAFAYSSLASITIPSSVTSISSNAVEGCSALTSISVVSGNTVYSGACNCLIEKGSGTLILGCKNSEIPEGVKSIGDYAFSRCTGLTSITIPASVETIGGHAFQDCSGLTSITIPNSVKSIGDYAFWNCTGLTSITIPSSVKTIGFSAFEGCSNLTSITIPSSVETIDDYAFRDCTGLTSITIPDSVKTIGFSAFEGCSGLASVFFNGTEAEMTEYRNSVISNNCAVLKDASWTALLKDKGACGTSLTWTLDTNGVLTISGSGAMADYGSAGAPWYKCCSLIKSAIIENGVTSIGGFAFTGCSNLTSINIPSSVKSIGEYAFAYSGLASIEIPASVETIGSYAFNGCNHLTNITILASVKSIGEGAFQDCTGLTSITIPDSVKSIGEYAFNGCSSLASITVPYGVTSIGGFAFNGCKKLTSITLPEGLTTIGEGVFQDCTGLTSITIPASVTSIGSHAFYSCSKLADVFYKGTSDEWKKITIDAFGNDCLTKAKIHHSPTYGGECGKNLSWVLYADGLLTISGTGAMPDYDSDVAPWYNYLIKSVVIEHGVTSIGSFAFFYFSNLTSITIPDSVTSIGEYAFNGCSSLASIKVPYGVTSIGEGAFAYSGLASITIPDSVKTIGSSAFEGCSNLTSITIPASVETIGSYAFYDCSNLTNITIPYGVKSIGDGAFRSCTGLTSITIPDSVTSIGDSAFQGCTGLTNITIPDSVETIGNSAFEGCSNLTSITIPYGVKSIGGFAFSRCTGLTSITIPASVETIGNYAFYGCSNLTSITIPDSVTSIGKYTFNGCSNLTSITIPDSVETIGVSAFEGCRNLTSITIPDSVTSIGEYAFYGCSNLTSITIPDSVTSIGNYAFYLCSKLADVFYKGTSDEWNSITIGSNNDCLTKAKIHHSPTEGGECEENLSWVLYEDGTLYIAGTGVMTGYGSPSDTPWYSFSESIKSVVIEHGVTSIGSNAFKSCAGLTSVTLPGSVTSVGVGAFNGCSGLENVYYDGTPLDWKKISIGSSNEYLKLANIICSFSLAKTIAISHHSQDITGQTVDIDMLKCSVYQLTATAAPDNAKQQFTWASSSTAVATVDTNGLVTFRKPGTVTITAAATDGSGKNAKVTFNVKYYDAAAKFTASTDVPSIGLEVDHRAQISVFGEDKTTALGSSVFEYTLSNVKNGPFIEVSSTGEITAIKPGGTTTVTAALINDPLGRKVTVSVKTIPVQTKTVFVLPPDDADIHTANDNYAEGFCAIDANGDIPSSADRAVSYALFVNKVPKGTTAEPRFVKVNAIDSDGNPISLPNTDYTWTSSNTKIATVAKDGTVTIKSNVDGACTITATSKDLAKAQGSIAVYVMDKTPRLDAAKVTLDVQKANTASVALVSSYGNDVDSVIFMENKSDVASTKVKVNYANEQITVNALGFLKNQTIKGQLVVTTKGNPTPYELPFSVVIKNSAPSVTVKQPSKFNLFYTDSSATLNVSVKNEQIEYIEPFETDYFTGTDNRDGTVTVTFKTPDPKPVTKATLKIHLVGYEQPVEKAITIGTVTTKPKLTVTPASATINTGLGNQVSEFAVYNNASGEYIDVTNMTTAAAWASLGGVGTNAVLTLNGATGGKAAISVRESNWASPITVYHTVNVKATNPVAKPGTGTLTLNSNFLNIAETTLTLDQANVSITGINKDLTAVPKGVDKDVAEDWFKVAYADGKITAEFSPSGKAAIESGALKTGTYSFSITPYAGSVDLKPVTLKISVKNTIPTVTASAVTLNKRLNETGVSTLKLSSAGYTVTGAVVSESNPNLYVTFNNNDGTLTVKLNSEAKALKAQTFSVTLKPTVRMDGYNTQAAAKPFTLKVSMIDKAPSASVSASGKIDAVSRGTGITYTLTKLSNAVGSVSSAELTGDNADLFTLTKLEPNDKGQPRYMLTLKDDAVCATNVTYKIMLRFTLDSGDVIETPVLKVKPSQSSLKLTAAPAAQIFYQSQSRDRVVTYTVKLTSPAGAEIGSIVPGKVSFWQNSLADQTKKIVISLDPNDKSVATVAITLKDTARFTSGKSYTLPLEVRAAGYAENTSVTKLNLTLKVMK